jgi:hypothetical protein
MTSDAEEISAGLDTAPSLGPEYPEKFVTSDAVYTVRSVDYVPSSTQETRSLFEDTQADIDRTWERVNEVSISISSASQEQVAERADKAKELVDRLATSYEAVASGDS